MTAPNPSQELQVLGPQEQQQVQAPQQAPQQPAPQAPQAPTPAQAEDRILSPEETENLLRHGTLEDPNVPKSPEEVQQAEMAGDFFATIPPEQAAQAPQAQAQMPAQLPQGVADAAVQQTLQQVSQPQVQPVQAQPPQVPAPGQPPTPGAPQAPALPQQTPREAALAAQLQIQQQQINTLTQQVQQPQAQPQQQPGVQPQGQQFQMQVPAQYMAALQSEDTNVQQQAMNAIVNGVAQNVYQQTMQGMDQRMEQVNPAIQQQIHVATTQADIKRDMYGTYPELSNMMEQVSAVATQMHQQGLTNGQWSEDLRDSIAERLSPMIPGLAQKVAQIRNARYGQVGQPVYQQSQQQFLPQVQPQQGLPPGVVPAQVVGGAHVPLAPQQGPMLVRDAQGNITQVRPQQNQQIAGPQARPGMQGQIDPELQDIWSTLGYS